MKALSLWICVAACGGSSSPAHPDAAVDAATIDAAFPCGTASCDKSTQYCYLIEAGFAPPVGCNALPAGCAGQPTCACITPTITDCAVSCSEHEGAVTAACQLP